MTTPVSEAELSAWRDADDLLDALGRLEQAEIPHERTEGLSAAVAELVRNEDEDVRQQALRVLVVKWKMQVYRSLAIQALRDDPEEAVRGTAAYGLAAVSTENTKKQDITVLLKSVLDNTESTHVRGCAYEGLLILHRRPAFPPMNRDFDPNRDIDYGWLDELRGNVGE